MTLQQLVDQYNAARNLRLDKDRESAKLKEIEVSLKRQLVARMSEEKLSVIGGMTCNVHYYQKDEPHPDSWLKIYKHILDTESFDLLHRRLTVEAVTARWEQNIEIPGIGRFPIDVITVSQITR